MRSSVDRWTRQLVRRGIQSGLIEGNDVWLAIGAVAWLFRFLRRRAPVTVAVEKLRFGESVLVTHTAPPPHGRRARRKAARKTAKAEARQARRATGNNAAFDGEEPGEP